MKGIFVIFTDIYIIPLYGGVPKAGWSFATYAQLGLVNIAKKNAS
jgi:hypothetical protein